ncbi:alkylated DNA repair protein alkB homolog 8-like [Lineus longissimus]|uniref:alkylated DNA repair protein alkB homolog 8-like n=1 Tax=Lineus longissimus TaxID=88925 RepID=UPI002B4E3379
MAAPTESGKLSKSDRKVRKKQSRSIHTLRKHEGIETVNVATNNLFVANAGLGNGITRIEVINIFRPFGILDNVVMIADKPYAFVCYNETESAERAHEVINGRPLKCPDEVSSTGLKFYTAYVENIPVPGVKPVTRCNLPPGLVLIPDFITHEYEKRLVECVKWDESDPEREVGERDQRSLKHRRVKHYGYEFIYGINNVDQEKPLPEGIPCDCNEVLDKILQLGCVRKRPDQLTVNQYEPGQGIPPHIDTHSAFDNAIISLSTGAQVVMDFRHPDGTHLPVVLPPRSLLVMTGESRYVWTHGITPRKSDVVETENLGNGLTLSHRGIRTSFTFRILRRRPCDCDYPRQCDSQTNTTEEERNVLPKSSSEAAALESRHVHEVYEEIASHFSDTRHSPWPKVAQFLKELPKGSMVVDVGCGNGKYLGVNSDLFIIGNDRSENLLTVCRERGFNVFICDCLSIPLRPGTFDACICIAVIHHLTTKERRLAAVRQIIDILQVGGRALIYVWALEQELHKVKSNYLKKSKMRKSHDVGTSASGIDCSMKGWDGFTQGRDGKTPACISPVGDCDMNMRELSLTDNEDKSRSANSCTTGASASESGILESDSSTASGFCQTLKNDDISGRISVMEKRACDNTVDNGGCTFFSEKYVENVTISESCVKPIETAVSDSSEISSCLPVHVNRTQFKHQDMLVPWHKKPKAAAERDQTEKVYHRFYHVFREGELEELCREVPGVRIIHGYYDKGNWCVIVEKTS